MSIFPQLVMNSLIASAGYALVAMSFTFTYAPTKFFNFAHGAFAVVGGYTVFALAHWFGVRGVSAVVAGVLMAGIVGYGLEKFVYLPLRRRRASNRVLLIASLGALTTMQAVVAMIFTSQFQVLSTGETATPAYAIAGAALTTVQALTIAAAVVVAGGLMVTVKYTRFGRAVRAIADDREVAEVVGINTNKVIGQVFFIGSCLMGLAGILIGYDTGLEPLMGLSLLLAGFAAAVIGGIGSLSGGLLGAILLGFVENFGVWELAGEWKSAIAFSLLIAFLIFRPKGIVQT